MKNYFHLAKAVFCMIPVLFFSGCSSDFEGYSEEPTYLTGSRTIVISANDNNTGEAYNSIYREYRSMYADTANTGLIISRVEDIAERITVLESYLRIEEEAVEHIINGSIPLKDYADVVLSTAARNMLISFLNSLDGMSDNEIHIEVIDFENEVLSNINLNGNDTEILLTTVSVMKYHTENGDDDWPDQGTNITKAVLYGSAENSSKAIIMALVVRLIKEGY